ncbi:MAG: DUF512 domain-containing protein [Candidatus Marinimicrobia bacterium]|nr:DUF512 domain-containing protein [Candidatus Neomarinimicrobiota bacterium]
MLKVIGIKPGSPAEKIGALPGDIIVTINDEKVNDFLDYMFYQSEEYLVVQVRRNGQNLWSPIEKEYDDELGFVLEPPKIRGCGNHCIFCFIDQNPKGMRAPIYFHDEDYRYSFLYGNFITLTNLTKNELNRIVRQKLSPLYISIHATDNDVRKALFCHKKDDHLMEKLQFLTQNGILIHAQIVLVPQLNDGMILQKTLQDLFHLRDHILSVAVVPVGLTRHRQSLPMLKAIDTAYAKNIVVSSRQWEKEFHNIEGDPFVTIADEFFLLGEEPLPSGTYYGPYYQIENGVGLVRDMLDDFAQYKLEFPKSIPYPQKILFITGKMIKPVMDKEILPELKKIKNLTAEFLAIKNNFYGDSVTVSGLLTGQDILDQTKEIAVNYNFMVLPPRCLNDDGLFLDNMSPDTLATKLNLPIICSNNNFMEIIEYASK